MFIQRASLADINPIVKITRTRQNRKALPFVMKVTLKDAIEHPGKNILLVAKNKINSVVGFIRLYCRNDRTVTLHEIAVLDENKGKGVGTALLAKAQKLAKKRQGQNITLKTPMDLIRTHNFYITNGFEKIGEQKTIKRLIYIFQKQI